MCQILCHVPWHVPNNFLSIWDTFAKKYRHLQKIEKKNSRIALKEHIVTQLCPTVYDLMDCSPWNSPGVGSCPLLQGIFPIQGSNPGLPQCGWSLYQLSHQGSPYFSRGSQ